MSGHSPVDTGSPAPRQVARHSNADRAALVALSSLPLMGPARLRSVLQGRSAGVAWRQLRAGVLPPVDAPAAAREAWVQASALIDPAELLTRHQQHGVAVNRHGRTGYPERLDQDPEPPAVVFSQGSLSGVDPGVATVGIVGTRRCSRYGRDVAFELGCVLGARGVTVVSGLALGIDAAAHAGTLQAGGVPIGVVAGGLDRVYPPANAALWADVASAGAVLCEHPLGVGAQRWMFPARNRIIAGLSDVLVVVESGLSGGSLYTVDAALERDCTVFAVPGPIRSPSSLGTNRLLADGAVPMCQPEDVLEALDLLAVDLRTEGSGLSAPAIRGDKCGGDERGGDERGGDEDERSILNAFGWQTRSLPQLAERARLPVTVVAAKLQLLIARHEVAQRGGLFDRIVDHRTRDSDGRSGQP